MTMLLILACAAAPLAACVGYLVGKWVGSTYGYNEGWEDACDTLIDILARPQYWNGIGVRYLLRRMRGEKV